MQSIHGQDTTLQVTAQLAGSLPAEDREPLHGRQGLNLQSAPTELPHGEPCTADGSRESSDQDSQWSDVGRHYGRSSSFCCFSLAMVQQCLRGEELRSRHQAALLELHRKALRDKARAELAWLSHQRRTVAFMALKYPSDHGLSPLVLSCLELLQDTEGASAMAEKQHKVLTELKREQVMLQEQLGFIASNCPPPPLLHAALGGGWSKI
ncbi:hypothetical protein CIB84_012283 [Bambusicola thoracicus]|uniref:Uncharacterized protein n=1 Tax=Bambusicola thoracicus TaxID=9083 RepID=A0A2P4SIN1_BAMTH|nr:hypothetical protein CIB84_012283 [Bambusicola thoracicus]